MKSIRNAINLSEWYHLLRTGFSATCRVLFSLNRLMSITRFESGGKGALQCCIVNKTNI